MYQEESANNKHLNYKYASLPIKKYVNPFTYPAATKAPAPAPTSTPTPMPTPTPSQLRENFELDKIYRKEDSPQLYQPLYPQVGCVDGCRPCPNSNWGNRYIPNFFEIAQTDNQNPVVGTKPFYKLGPTANVCQLPWYPLTMGYLGSFNPPPPQMNHQFYPWYTLQGGRY